MRFKLLVTSAFLIIPFFITSGTSAEIFELVIDYDITASDIEAGDFNNDGREDFAITDWIVDSSYYEIFLSNGDCSFTRLGPVYVDTSEVGQLLTGDFNEDSNEDLLLMSLEETWLYIGDGTGVFTLDVVFPWSLCNGCIEDVNNDGYLDILGIPINSLVMLPYGDSVIVMLGDGTGGFTEVWVYDEVPPYIGYYSSQLAYFDDSDTFIDLCVPCGIGFLIFEGIGDGTFNTPDYYEVTISGEAYQEICTCGDFNEDGYTDIAFAGTASMGTHSTYIFLNQQDGTFLQTSYGYFSGACGTEKIATADLDLDGHLDLSVEGSIAGYGDGIFNAGGSGWLSTVPGADFLDMDIDEDLDLVMKWGGIFRNITINLGIEEESSGSFTNLVLNVSPNPFHASVSIEVSGFPDASGNLQIFDISGRLVAELEVVPTEGGAVFHWNGVASSGVELPSGIYTVMLSGGGAVNTVSLLKLE